MHGIIHKTLKEYVVAKTDAETWEMIVDRADLEPTLYLPISSYDDHEIDRILETLSSMAVQNGRQIERDFGRTLAPELLTTFNAHLRDDWDLFDVLEHLESITDGVGAATNANSLPTVSGTRVSAERVRVTYRTDRERVYCGLAQGILEGLADAFDGETTVTETACVHDGDETCAFRVERR
ncbi:heme NO-binding domain-containing protein [Natronorubrum halophilum]|uniref:heme NO-binding domain-containing protein n=1 Tax=Natronorubrum halophilum TaxID=1702106 RepID=UPI0010C1FC0F|nr:heme NO-binding domain-containing protein [Natronorubrum halophilum]